ncbi:TPA: oligosaccharide flippase family protein [Vibrio parahaemolyticus]
MSNPNNLKKGGAYIVGLVIFTRVVTFIGQWVLGLYLFPSDFAIIAILNISILIISGLKENGVAFLIMGSRDDLETKFWEFTSSAYILSLIAIIILLFASPIFYYIYEDFRIIELILISLPSLFFTVVCSSYRAILNVEFKFKEISIYEGLGVAITSVSLIFLAFIGFSVYSIPISQLLGIMTQSFLYKRSANNYIQDFKKDNFLRNGFDNIKKFKWTVSNSYISSLVLNGDYLILSFTITKISLGYYYFGYQLVSSMIQVISTSINYLILPVFSSIRSNRTKALDAFYDGLHMISFISGGFCLGTIMLVPFLIDYFWSGKWNGSIMVVVAILAIMPIRLISSPFSTSIIDAFEKYRKKFYILALEGISTIIIVYLSSSIYGLNGAVIGLLFQRATFGLIQYFYVIRLLGGSIFLFTKLMLKVNVPFYSSLLFLSKIEVNKIEDINIMYAVCIVTYLMLAYVFNRNGIKLIFKKK